MIYLILLIILGIGLYIYSFYTLYQNFSKWIDKKISIIWLRILCKIAYIIVVTPFAAIILILFLIALKPIK